MKYIHCYDINSFKNILHIKKKSPNRTTYLKKISFLPASLIQKPKHKIIKKKKKQN